MIFNQKWGMDMDRLRKTIQRLINWLLDLLYPEIDDDNNGDGIWP